MELNRKIIKNQAKTLIKGKVIPLCLAVAIVLCLTSLSTILSSSIEITDKGGNFTIGDPFGSFDIDEFEEDSDDGEIQWDSDFFGGFSGNVAPTNTSVDVKGKALSLLSDVADLLSIAQVVFYAMHIMLIAVFLQLIRGEYKGLKPSLEYMFKNYFDKNFFKRYFLLVAFEVAIGFGLAFFLVPGILLYLRWYFALYIMADKPGITISQAMQTSNKMTKSHRGELFKLELSFLGWHFLTLITCGVAGIYAMPYIHTTKALYYENFKIRAMQELKVSEVDFLTEEERKQQYYDSVVNSFKPPQNADFGSNENVDYFNSQY